MSDVLGVGGAQGDVGAAGHGARTTEAVKRAPQVPGGPCEEPAGLSADGLCYEPQSLGESARRLAAQVKAAQQRGQRRPRRGRRL